MEYELLYNGDTKTVKIDAAAQGNIDGNGLKAVLADKEISLDVVRLSDNSFSLLINGQSKTVYVAESDNELFVQLEGRIIRFEKAIDDQKKFSQDQSGFGAKDKIVTPMPGKVIKILVAEGDKVDEGQPLVIVESMKMENEIKSPAKATVKSVHFQPGDLVNPDQPIIKLEPEES